MPRRLPYRPDPFAAAVSLFSRTLTPFAPFKWLGRCLRGRPVFSEVSVPLRRGGAGLDGLTIAFVSDLHAGNFMGRSEVEQTFAAVASRRPDLLALGGDIIDHRAEELRLLRGLFDEKPPLGVFAIRGNHEYRAPDLDLWTRILEGWGVQVLLNRGVPLERNGDRLWLAGVDDLGWGRPDLARALHGRDAGDPIVLLAHEPDHFREAQRAGVDLTLSGHTHGGQIVIRGWTPVRHTSHGYWRGRFTEGGCTLYVGRGAGTTALPIRFGAPPEVPIVRLVVAGDSS